MRDIGFLQETYFSHRGYHSESEGIPENSVGAFLNSIKHNYPIELDIQLTRDKRIIVFHDENLKRLCNLDLCIKDSDYEQIKKMKLLDTDYHIPLFTDVLKRVDGSVPLLIEIKDCEIDDLHLIANELHGYQGIFTVQSFNHFIVKWFQVNEPNIIRGILLEQDSKLITFTYQQWGNPDFLSISKEIIKLEYFQKYRNKGFPILIWTIQNVNEIHEYQFYYDSIIFENFNPK
jgi:glycerophosphoryl diester phosphodiesterase